MYLGLCEVYVGGSRNTASVSEEAECGGPLGRVPLLRSLEDMLRKALDMGICLHRAPFTSEGEPGIRRGADIPGILMNEGGLLY
jgi:hypothetical protein